MLALFGHQSVGQNLIEGIDDLRREGAKVPLVCAIDERAACESVFTLAAFRIGENRDPLAKLRHFSEIVTGDPGRRAGLALFKFCYVDLVDPAQAAPLFAAYARTIDRLQTQSAGVAIAHVTVPLRRVSFGPRAMLRRLLGDHHPEAVCNAARHEFNERLRERYGTGDRVFDLAAVESAGSLHGSHTSPGPGGRVPMLAGELSDDGGHLNATGRRLAAQAFVRFLNELRASLS